MWCNIREGMLDGVRDRYPGPVRQPGPGQRCLAAGAVTLIMNSLDPDSWPAAAIITVTGEERGEHSGDSRECPCLGCLPGWAEVITRILGPVKFDVKYDFTGHKWLIANLFDCSNF